MDALRNAIEHCRGQAGLARRLTALTGSPLSKMTVNQWLKRGLPPSRVLSVAAATDWRVTPHQLAPEIYPHRCDGMPIDLRRCDEVAA